MDVHGLTHLNDLVQRYKDTSRDAASWLAIARAAEWKTPHDVRGQFPKVSILGGKTYIFNICGTKYRLAVKIAFNTSTVLIVRAGTHKEYDSWKF